MGELKRIKTALIGSGAISKSYLTNIKKHFHIIELVGCSDIIPERSARRAEEFGIRQMTNQEIYDDESIQIVINTTYPLAHYTVTKEALMAGKHVYSEKMIAVEPEEGKELVALARAKNRHFTVAPDTFLGAGWQTARFYIDAGMIGEPISAMATCIREYRHGGEVNREPKSFTFSPGGGIPFDMGGYYLHSFINLFGPMSRVTGFCKTRDPEKKYTNPRNPRYGETYTADSPNTLSASLEFCNGVYASLLVTSESALFPTPVYEVHGTQGFLACFDPNNFNGPLVLHRKAGGPTTLPLVHGYDENDVRGLGVADMAYAIKNNRRPRANCDIGCHAFEAVHGIIEGTQTNKIHVMQSTCQRPAAIKPGQFWGTSQESMLDD